MPVARFLARLDERRSLHHLIGDPTGRLARPEWADDVRARRRFWFRCGACDLAHPARVWEIATQRRCGCGVLMVVPAPAAGGALLDGDVPAPVPHGRLTGLYCPRCGGFSHEADATRRCPARCAACDRVF